MFSSLRSIYFSDVPKQRKDASPLEVRRSVFTFLNLKIIWEQTHWCRAADKMYALKLWPLEEWILGLTEKLRWKRHLHSKKTGSCTLGNPEVCTGIREWKLIMKFRYFGTEKRNIVLPNWMALPQWKMAFCTIQLLQQVLPTILKEMPRLNSTPIQWASWDSSQIWFVHNMWPKVWFWPCFLEN